MKKINLSTSSMRGKWPFYIAVIISLFIAYYAYIHLQPSVYQKEAYTETMVAAQDLKPFTKVTSADLAYKNVLKTSLSKDALQNANAVVGKVTNTQITAGEPFYSQQLDNIESHKDTQFIAISVDLPRSVGGTLVPGDIVDIYWIDSVANQMWHKIGSNAVIVNILDSSGSAIKLAAESVGLNSNTKAITPTMVVVAVDKADINPLIGAATSDLTTVLVKKLAKSDDTLDTSANQQTANNTIPEGRETNANKQ